MTKTRYEAKNQTLWVLSSIDSDTLFDELQWVKVLKEGKFESETVTTINIVFSESASAEYNSQPLSFSKLGVYVGTLVRAKKYVGEDISFDSRDDFGV